MADYMNQSIFQPSIPRHLISDEDRHIIEAFSIILEPDGEDKFYLYADDWCGNGRLKPKEPEGKEIELYEDDLFARLQEIIRRSNGELPWIFKESAYSCSRMLPDGFGGGAVFITADDIQYCFTGQWLEERISAAETGDSDVPKAEPFVQQEDEPTNEDRANRIDTVMQAYCLTLEGRDFNGDEDDVKDLLTDLMHFCLRLEIDFEENLRVARDNYQYESKAGSGKLGCPECGCFLEVSRTDTLLGIDREIFECENCAGTYIRELTVEDSPLEKAVKCVGCSNMIPLSSAHIFYQSDELAHYIGECCRDEQLKD